MGERINILTGRTQGPLKMDAKRTLYDSGTAGLLFVSNLAAARSRNTRP
jgi:hypothetical protein